MSRMLSPIGGGGSADLGWRLAASVDMAGTGGSIGAGGTFEAGGITWTFRRTGAGATCTQGAGGITLGYAGSGANYTVGALIADVIDDFSDDEPLIFAALCTGSVVGTFSSVSVGYWVESAGTMSRGWVGGISPSGCIGTTLTGIGTAVEFRSDAVAVSDPRVIVGVPCRRSGTSASFISSATLPVDPTTGGVYNTMARFSTAPTGSPNWLGLAGYTNGAQSVVVSRIGVYRRSGPA